MGTPCASYATEATEQRLSACTRPPSQHCCARSIRICGHESRGQHEEFFERTRVQAQRRYASDASTAPPAASPHEVADALAASRLAMKRTPCAICAGAKRLTLCRQRRAQSASAQRRIGAEPRPQGRSGGPLFEASHVRPVPATAKPMAQPLLHKHRVYMQGRRVSSSRAKPRPPCHNSTCNLP